jgi:SAM-dependent methyltransferase
MTTGRSYEGAELDLFQAARQWKTYWSGKIAPHLGQSVLEVGAGFATNTPLLFGSSRKRWLCLEPDPALVARIAGRLQEYPWAATVETMVGTLNDLSAGETFDTLLYIDVLEHIEDDRGEMQAAFSRLKPGGKIVVLSPAHPWLFTDFDRAIGHYRRYTKSSLRDCTPPGARLVELYYLDSVGLLASATNRFFLHQSMPTARQIDFWDRWLVTNSRWMDPILNFQLGKTVIAVWKKDVKS